MQVVVQRDSDGDIEEVRGPFADIASAMAWLRDVRAPQWAAEYKADTGHDADFGFFGNGASEGNTGTWWNVKAVDAP